MILPRLGPRLRRLLELVPPAGAVADVGAGHGALAVHLAASGRRVVAVEAGARPYDELRANLRRWEAGAAVDARRGDALGALEHGEVAGVVAAGLGGHALARIADDAGSRGVRWVVLQCVQRREHLEAWLGERGWTVLASARPEQRGHVYPTWVVEVPPG